MAAYDAIADWYDEFVGDGALDDDPFYPTAGRLIGGVEGATVCDLACGQGRVARHLASLGARVIAVDVSARLLEIARRRTSDSARVSYVRDDAAGLPGIRSDAFDGVVCHMALMDIADLDATIAAVRRVLRPGGWFVFSILHPCFQSPASGELRTPEGHVVRTVRGYAAEGFWRSDARPGPPGRVGSHHRTLATYFNRLVACGLTMERLEEPAATPALARARPVWAEVPATLASRWRRSG